MVKKASSRVIIFSVVLFSFVLVFANYDMGQPPRTNQIEAGLCLGTSDKAKIDFIQKRISEIYNKLLQSTVRVSVNGSGASGVMISKDGYVLTAAHVVWGAKEREILLYDGSKYTAKVLGQDLNCDYALMKIDADKEFVFSKLGKASDLVKDEVMLMFGHGGPKEEERPAIGKVGFYKGVNSLNYLVSSCIMMPGDSGGPIFDLNGHVMGVCSYIGRGLEQNFYASVDLVANNWEKLIAGEVFNDEYLEEYKKYPMEVTQKPIEADKPFVLKGGKSALAKIFPFKNKNLYKSVIKLESSKGDYKINTHATIIDKKGLAVGKSSDILEGGLTGKLYNDKNIEVTVLGRDAINDLALLKVESKSEIMAIPLAQNGDIKYGQLLGTITTNQETPKWIGMLGLETKKEESDSFGFFGVHFVYPSNDNAMIEELVEGGPAMLADFRVGDKILKFNDLPVADSKEVVDEVRKTKPNEEVRITFLRNEEEKTVKVVMGEPSQQGMPKNHPADYTEVSKRKDDFPCVFVHDMPLYIEDCGTPVVNLKGEVLGINIARKNRTSSLAIPIQTIDLLAKKMAKNY